MWVKLAGHFWLVSCQSGTWIQTLKWTLNRYSKWQKLLDFMGKYGIFSRKFLGIKEKNSTKFPESIITWLSSNNVVKWACPRIKGTDFPAAMWKFPATLFKVRDPWTRHASKGSFGLWRLKINKNKLKVVKFRNVFTSSPKAYSGLAVPCQRYRICTLVLRLYRIESAPWKIKLWAC